MDPSRAAAAAERQNHIKKSVLKELIKKNGGMFKKKK
jgi:hypothetical protein